MNNISHVTDGVLTPKENLIRSFGSTEQTVSIAVTVPMIMTPWWVPESSRSKFYLELNGPYVTIYWTSVDMICLVCTIRYSTSKISGHDLDPLRNHMSKLSTVFIRSYALFYLTSDNLITSSCIIIFEIMRFAGSITFWHQAWCHCFKCWPHRFEILVFEFPDLKNTNFDPEFVVSICHHHHPLFWKCRFLPR